MTDTWDKLIYDDYLQGAKTCFENAKGHFTTAELLEKENQVGFAITHLIFATEEATKSLALQFKFLETYIDNETLDGLFSRHKTKHKGAKAFNSLYFNLANILTLSREFINGKIVLTNKEFETKISQMIFDAFRQNPKSDKLHKVYSFWDNLDRERELGLYVELHGDKWWYPNKTKKEKYTDTYKRAKEFLEEVNKMMDFITNPSEKERIEKSREFNKKRNEETRATLDKMKRQTEEIIKYLRDNKK